MHRALWCFRTDSLEKRDNIQIINRLLARLHRKDRWTTIGAVQLEAGLGGAVDQPHLPRPPDVVDDQG